MRLPLVILRIVKTCLVSASIIQSYQLLADELVTHPLDPLTAAEFSTVVSTLQTEKLVDESSRFPLIVLREPNKHWVLQWQQNQAISRQAFVIIKQGSQTFEAEVNISQRKVTSWKLIPDAQPGILLTEEWAQAQKIVKAHPAWQTAVRSRGIDKLQDIICTPLTLGYFGIEEQEGRRLVKVVCYQSHGISNYWGRPIEGLIAVVDFNERKVIKLIDSGAVPLPKAPVDLDENSVGILRTPTNPISIIQSRGPTFKLNGHRVRWQKWRFHYRIDPRLGLVVSMVGYNDNGKLRSILYQGSLSELFVPYMDPDVGWYFRTYLDAGEYGVGKLAAPMIRNVDCPSNAIFFNTVFADDWGNSYTQERAACLFERYAGDISWRHYEAESGLSEARKRTELVLRSISTVGNYDYIFDWVFRQDGTIKVAVGATGIEQVKAVKSRTLKDDVDGYDTAFGRMVAEHIVAPNHDHFFSFRLDLDIEGQKNSFLSGQLKTKKLSGKNPRKSIWVMDSGVATHESQAKLQIKFDKPALWRVINPNVLGPIGYPVSYQLRPGANAVSLLGPDDFVQQRAGFTKYHLWVTPYNPQELYAAGTYPNQSKGRDGLQTWTSADRPIQNTDVVLWYTVGFHHVVRTEDWPVLSTNRHSFELRPFDFFPRNPALDIPRQE